MQQHHAFGFPTTTTAILGLGLFPLNKVEEMIDSMGIGMPADCWFKDLAYRSRPT